jgi:uncharacterized OB-fold protein
VSEAPRSGRAAAPDVSAMAGPIVDLVAGVKPIAIPETAGFWEGTAAQELRIQVCRACGHRQLPGGPCCRECLSPDLEWRRASGRGSVFSFTVVHRALHPAFTAQVPYVLADVQLEEGPVLTSNVTDVPPQEVRIGMPLEVWFDQPDADAFGVPFRLPKFRPRSEA